jgi:hypothetical protein
MRKKELKQTLVLDIFKDKKPKAFYWKKVGDVVVFKYS